MPGSDAGSHLALDETPEGDTGWCQSSENTSRTFEKDNDTFIYKQILHVIHVVRSGEVAVGWKRFFNLVHSFLH